MQFRERVQKEIDVLLGAAERLKLEGVWNPASVITRYPHAKHVTPRQARRMAALGIFAEISFESDFEVAAYAQHALPSLLYYGTPVLMVRNPIVANSSFEQQYARAHALIESNLSGEMPIKIAVVDAIRDGAMRGEPVEHEPDQRQVYIYQLDRDEREPFLHGYEKIHQDVERYLTMVQPARASAPHG